MTVFDIPIKVKKCFLITYIYIIFKNILRTINWHLYIIVIVKKLRLCPKWQQRSLTFDIDFLKKANSLYCNWRCWIRQATCTCNMPRMTSKQNLVFSYITNKCIRKCDVCDRIFTFPMQWPRNRTAIIIHISFKYFDKKFFCFNCTKWDSLKLWPHYLIGTRDPHSFGSHLVCFRCLLLLKMLVLFF